MEPDIEIFNPVIFISQNFLIVLSAFKEDTLLVREREEIGYHFYICYKHLIFFGWYLFYDIISCIILFNFFLWTMLEVVNSLMGYKRTASVFYVPNKTQIVSNNKNVYTFFTHRIYNSGESWISSVSK